MLALVAARAGSWDELWRWQCLHRGGLGWPAGGEPPRELLRLRPLAPDRALFVGATTPGLPNVCGLGLHETRGYVFLDDLTTNPDVPVRLRLRAVELLLRAAQQYAISVGKPICAFTSVPSLYRIARRLGFVSRPAGALLVFADAAIPLEGPSAKKTGRPLSKAAGSPVSERNVRRTDRQPNGSKVPGQSISDKSSDVRDKMAKFRAARAAREARRS